MTLKLNSTFGMIGNTTADNMTVKVRVVIRKNLSFRFSLGFSVKN